VSETQHENTPGDIVSTDASPPPDKVAEVPAAGPSEESADALIVARVSDDFRGTNILLLDMRKITPIVDFFVIATATSKRQMKALAEEADMVMKKRGSPRRGAEGEGETVWMLRDYGHVVLHVFTPEGRQLYALENLWADAPHVDWRE
jgi:ribosome-associated protein